MNTPQQVRFPLWDLPTRIFHWAVVACIPLAWWSAENENYTVHKWTGYTILVLVVSRAIWGFIGSRHSRFRDFLVGPAAVLDYLRGRGAGSPGHNPLGGWSVVLLLLLLSLQAVSGLFNSDDVLFSGPLYHAAGGEFRDAMGALHEFAFDALLVLVCLHLLAVLYHQLHRREKLIQAMLRGRAAGREGEVAPVSPWLALATLGAVAAALWWLLAQFPPPAPAW